MRLRKRLIGFAATVILFTLLSGATGYSVAYKLVGSMQDSQVSIEALRNQMQADMMHDALRADVFAAAFDGLQEGQPHKADALKDYAEHVQVFTAALKQNEGLDLDPALALSIAAMRKDVDLYIALSREAIDLAYRDPAAAPALISRFLVIFKTLEQEMGASSDLIEETVTRAKQAADATAATSMTIILVLGGAAVLAVLVLSTWITRSILRILGAEPSDVKQLVSAVERGELYARPALRAGDNESIMAMLVKMVATLGVTVTEARRATNKVASASADLRQGNHALSARTEHQASALEETASSMEELTATVRQNADNAGQANALAVAAASAASEGSRVVSRVVDTMDTIKGSAQKMTEIIGVIDAIAFQTNILALNAAVEAARAGEQGRGFAIVATEVRALAHRSAEAARQIKGLISASVNAVDDGAQLVGQAGDAMRQIVEGIHRVADVMADIKAASAEQSAGIEQVNEAIIQMDQVTQQNAALVEEAAASAESLRNQAVLLTKSLSVFTLEAGEQAHAAGPARPGQARRLALA